VAADRGARHAQRSCARGSAVDARRRGLRRLRRNATRRETPQVVDYPRWAAVLHEDATGVQDLAAAFERELLAALDRASGEQR
jgi:hypothetical protein